MYIISGYFFQVFTGYESLLSLPPALSINHDLHLRFSLFYPNPTDIYSLDLTITGEAPRGLFPLGLCIN